MSKKNKLDLCTACCQMSHKYHSVPLNEVYSIDLNKFDAEWRKLFIRVCTECFEINKAGAKFLFSCLAQGNWKRLHLTEDEKHIGLAYWVDEFCSDLFYCSDRWSVDRLIRVHWLYRNIHNELCKLSINDE